MSWSRRRPLGLVRSISRPLVQFHQRRWFRSLDDHEAPRRIRRSRRRLVLSTCSATSLRSTLITQLEDLICERGMSRRHAATHGDSSLTKLMAHGGPGTPSSAPIWRRAQPSAYKSAARFKVHRDTV